MLCRIFASTSIAFVLSALASSSAMATSQRTFVASYGNDTNPCSLPLPCRTFAAAIAQTNISGEVIVLDSAGYGPANITQSVSIIAPGGVYAGVSNLSIAGDGITVDAPGGIVALVGLSINGQGMGLAGIRMIDGLRLRIERCEITKLSGNGLWLAAAGSIVIVDNTIVRDNPIGIAVFAPMTLTLNRVRVETNTTGLAAASAANITVRDSIIVGNMLTGLQLQTGPLVGNGQLAVTNTTMSDNGWSGILVSGGGGSDKQASLQVTNSTIVRNGGGVLVDGGFAGATIAGTLISGNGDGVRIDGKGTPGAATVTLSGSQVTENAYGILVSQMGELRTPQTNIVDRNTTINIDSSAGGIVTVIPGM